MSRKISLKLAAVSAIGLAALLTGCTAADSDAGTDTAAETGAAEQDAQDSEAQDSAAENEDTSAAPEGDSGSLGGSYTLEVAGAEVTMEEPVVACEETGGNMNIAVASSSGNMDAASGLGAVLTTGDSPSVVSVGLVTADGDAVAYQEGAGIGEASVTVDGNTYEITGTGIITNLEDPTSMDEAEFDFTVTCP